MNNNSGNYGRRGLIRKAQRREREKQPVDNGGMFIMHTRTADGARLSTYSAHTV